MNASYEEFAVEIPSSRSTRSLRFHGRDGDYFSASVEGDNLRATKRIWGYTDCEFLVQLFESIAHEWRGWQGERIWKSIEGDLSLIVTSRITGQITIAVALRNNDGEDNWQIHAPIFSEAGQLERIAKQLASFFR